MSALVGFLAAWVAAFRLAEWAFADHDRDDLFTGLAFAVLAVVAFLFAGASA